jgi:hypothetical protein
MNSNSPNLSGISVRKIAGVTDALSKVRVGKDAGTLTASPESGETSGYFKATWEETVELPVALRPSSIHGAHDGGRKQRPLLGGLLREAGIYLHAECAPG